MTTPTTGAGPTDTLVAQQADGSLWLRLTRCARDGALSFPPERFGCQRCGAPEEDLLADLTPARGRLVRGVTTYRFRGPGPKPPFAIGDIALEAGPVIRALLGENYPAGTPLVGRLEAGQLEAGRLETQGESDTWVVFVREPADEQAPGSANGVVR